MFFTKIKKPKKKLKTNNIKSNGGTVSQLITDSFLMKKKIPKRKDDI